VPVWVIPIGQSSHPMSIFDSAHNSDPISRCLPVGVAALPGMRSGTVQDSESPPPMYWQEPGAGALGWMPPPLTSW
jgi:hypothetical protein